MEHDYKVHLNKIINIKPEDCRIFIVAYVSWMLKIRETGGGLVPRDRGIYPKYILWDSIRKCETNRRISDFRRFPSLQIQRLLGARSAI
jgi:hypothetical protein